jgi:hypothetical protein
MDKNELEVIKKIKEIMTSFKESPNTRGGYFLGSRFGPNEFAIVETEKERNITLMSAVDSGQKAKKLTDAEAFEIVEDYFANGGKSLKITVNGKTRYNGVINALMKKEPTGEFLSMVLDAFFQIKDDKVFNDVLIKINKSISDKSCDSHYGRDLSFKVLARIGKNGNSAELYNYTFPEICGALKKFKITEREYPVLHNMFTYFKNSIENDANCRSAVIDILRNCVPSNDWGMFKSYLKDERQVKPQSQMTSMFEEKSNPKYHLNISEDFVVNRYPSVSLTTDYGNMIGFLVSMMRDFKDELGLEQCSLISQNNKVSSLYFLSKDETPVNGEKIKTIFSSLIEFYAELKDKKENVTKEALGLALKANLLAFELEKPEEKEQLKNSRRANKI